MRRGELPIAVRAVHEAAHVVAAHLHGCAVRSVSVVESAHSLASVNTERNLLQEIRACSDPNQQMEIAIAEVCIARAGPEAQARYVADFDLSLDLREVGCQDDWIRCGEVSDAVRAVLPEPLKEKLFITAQERAQIVTRECWADILRLALRLGEAPTLGPEGVAGELTGVPVRWRVPSGPAAALDGATSNRPSIVPRGKFGLVRRVAMIAAVCALVSCLAWALVGPLLR